MGGLTEKGPSVPLGHSVAQLRRKISTTIDDPAYGLGAWGRREYAGTQGRVGSGTPDYVFDGWSRGRILNLV